MQNPLLQKAKENLLHGEKAPVSGRMRDGEKGALPRHSPTVCDGPHVPESGGYSWDDGFCGFAFGSAQNDKVRGIPRRLKIFGLNKPIKRERESSAVFIGY